MGAKSLIRSPSSKPGGSKRFWHHWLLILAMVPLGVGLLLIISAFTGVVVWGTLEKQVLMGGLYILFSFAASNAIQRQWTLAAGWTLLGLGAWLGLNHREAEAKIIAAALFGTSIALLAREFFRRRHRYLNAERR
jgi:hypothetical protein